MGHGHEARRDKRAIEKAEMNNVDTQLAVPDKLYKDILKLVKNFRLIYT
jgi:hypothetical protein